MAFTSDELNVVNQALNRIGASSIAASDNGNTKSDLYVKANLHYSQTRDALLRSFVWNFASDRVKLDKIQTIVMDTEPTPDAWSVGDELTGLSTGFTATVVSVTSDSEYELKYVSGTLEDYESITNGTVEIVYYNGVKLTWEDSTVYYETAIGDSYSGDLMLTNTTDPIGDWSFEYELPADSLRVKSIFQDDGGDVPVDRYTVERGRLLTNYDEVGLRYIKKVTDPTVFDPLFTEILILQLALKLLGPLAGNATSQARIDLQNELKIALARARSVCASEPASKGFSYWNMARYSSGKITGVQPL